MYIIIAQVSNIVRAVHVYVTCIARLAHYISGEASVLCSTQYERVAPAFAR